MRKSPKVAVIGAGGHAKVVVATLQAAGYEAISLFDDDPATQGREVLGFPVVGPAREVAASQIELGIVAVGSNSKRKEMVSTFRLDWISVIHPSATVHPSVSLGVGVVVFAGAVIQPDCVLGEHAIINTGATLDHDCQIGDFAHIAPGVNLCGGVVVGEGSLVGVGASAVPEVKVGPWSTVGAGAALVEDLPAKTLALGVPARPVQMNSKEGSDE